MPPVGRVPSRGETLMVMSSLRRMLSKQPSSSLPGWSSTGRPCRSAARICSDQGMTPTMSRPGSAARIYCSSVGLVTLLATNGYRAGRSRPPAAPRGARINGPLARLHHHQQRVHSPGRRASEMLDARLHVHDQRVLPVQHEVGHQRPYQHALRARASRAAGFDCAQHQQRHALEIGSIPLAMSDTSGLSLNIWPYCLTFAPVRSSISSFCFDIGTMRLDFFC